MKHSELRYARSVKTGKICIVLDEEVRDPNGVGQVYLKTMEGERFIVPLAMFTDTNRFVPVTTKEATNAADVSRSEVERCPYCDASMVVYKHTMNKPLLQALAKLDAAGGIANLKTLGLTRNQWDNFQKMKYLGLVEQVADETGARKKGVWAVTPLGKRFVRSEASIQKSARTYRGEVIELIGPYVHACYLDGDYSFKKVEEYRKEAEAAPK